ncbi:hypothetical protein C942_02394 [Photobacterium marinum]|uniref:Uncharacterized protein n=2 Tax=Photobacterium marinum TaxID=1056511 RepID=L8J714_9GAMM|nr:hypothetical protein C942_02394 [Photobacterium marinum]
MADAHVHSDETDFTFVDFIKGLFSPEADIGLLLVKAMEATDPEGMHPERADYILNTRVPLLALYRCFLSDEQEEFAEKLDEALKSHEDWWSNDASDPEGWISLELVAVLALAYMNKGWTVPVESDYIPQWLVTGKYL